MTDDLRRMDRRVRCQVTVLVALLTLCLVQQAKAQCACAHAPTCKAYRDSPFIFSGTVTAGAVASPSSGPQARLAVGDVLRGVGPAVLDVSIGGECDASFSVGQEYLVYTSKY